MKRLISVVGILLVIGLLFGCGETVTMKSVRVINDLDKTVYIGLMKTPTATNSIPVKAGEEVTIKVGSEDATRYILFWAAPNEVGRMVIDSFVFTMKPEDTGWTIVIPYGGFAR